MKIDDVTGIIIDAAMKVHTALGPGLLESAYEACLAFELRRRGLRIQCQIELPVIYDSERIDVGYRVDLLIEGTVIVELKSVEALAPIHSAQLISYLKLSRCPVGLLINFNSLKLKEGSVRKINSQTFTSGDVEISS